MRFLLDGERQIEADSTHDGNVGSGYALEYVAATMSLKGFPDIVNATKVEGRVCND